MATYVGNFRRGLPREPGGDFWPSLADIELNVDVGGLAAASQNAASAPTAQEQPKQASMEFVAEEHPAIPAEPELNVAPSVVQGMVVDQVLRRGLPRTQGGEPWPPEIAGQVESRGPADAGTSVVQEQADRAESSPAVAAPPIPESTKLGHGQSHRKLRTGLPRVAGGPAYPEYSLVEAPSLIGDQASAAIHTAVPEAAPVPTAAAQPAAAQVSSATPRVSTPQAPAELTQRAAAPVAKPSKPVNPAGPAASSGAPGGRFRLSQNKRTNIVLWTVILLAEVVLVVFAARGLTSLPAVAGFLERFPGETHLPAGETTGMPAWVRWQHFLNLFFMVLIIRSGIQIRREQRPGAYWTPSWSKGGAGKVSLTAWFHQCLDVLWLLNGLVFVIVMFATDHWMRIIPTSWEVFPNAISAMLQYVSLDWPTENGWVNYNSLQQLMYALTIFVAAPLAAATGLRMSSLWPKNAKTLSKVYPVEVARAIHFPVMFYVVVFVIAHVALVFATGALRNLNHMYAGQDVVSWTGLLIFLGSVLLVVGAWLAARPIILAPIASLMGKVSSR